MSDIAGVGDLVSSLLKGNKDDDPNQPTGRMRFADAAKALMRNTVFDATSELLAAKSWAQLRMADLANAAGISRQTLYKEFGSRQGLIEAYLFKIAEEFIADAERALRANVDDPREALASSVEAFLTRAAEDPVTRTIINGRANEEVLSLVTNQAGPLLRMGTERLAGIMRECWPEAELRMIELFAENMVRVVISHAASPTGAPRETGEGLAELFGPGIDLALGKLDVPAQASTDPVAVN